MNANLLWLVLIVLLIAAVFPAWPYARAWGYWPSGGLVLLLIVVLLLLYGPRP